jgi:PAS domain S-box-containing protein
MKRDIKGWHIIALVIIIAGVLLTAWTAHQQDQQMRRELLTKAKIAAVNIDPVIVEALNGSPSDIGSPDYQRLKIQMAQIKAADPSIRFAYLMGQRPEEIFFYVDSEPADSLGYSPPGQAYPEATALLKTDFSDKTEITEGPISDRWGTWVSVAIPITDQKTGRVVAFIGIDVDGRYWNYEIARSCADVIGASLLILLLVVTFGLTQRRNQREQQRLAASENKFSRTFHTNPALMAVSSIEGGRFLDVNMSFLETIGYSREEVIGRTPSDIGLYSDPAQWDVIQSQLKETGQVGNVDVKVKRKDHDMLDGLFSGTNIDVAGLPCLLMVIHDITERRRAEAALRESERTINILLNAVPDDLALVNSERKIIAANESMAEKLGQTPNALTGRAIGEFMPSSVLSATLERVINSQKTDGQIYFEERWNGRWLETMVFPVTDRDGTDVRIAIQSRDITHWKDLEEELKKAGLSQANLNIEKFQTLNDQIRNPLQVIKGYLSIDPVAYHDAINKQVAIIDKLVTQLDMGWLESVKVRQFLLKHSYRLTTTEPQQGSGP